MNKKDTYMPTFRGTSLPLSDLGVKSTTHHKQVLKDDGDTDVNKNNHPICTYMRHIKGYDQ